MNSVSLESPLTTTDSLVRAGRWFLESGIQESGGGVARFYRADTGRNLPISTEITGYAASALVYLYRATGEPEYLERAIRTAHFLSDRAWDTGVHNFVFEYGPGAQAMLYFFDCGIIMRGLLAVWRETKDGSLLDRAAEGGRAMMRDFPAGDELLPILQLPGKAPLTRDWRWSRNPGCYQLKSALAWRDLAEITGERDFATPFEALLDRSLKDYAAFLPGSPDPARVMDRLHAFCYFLEALLVRVQDGDRVAGKCALVLADGIPKVAGYLREIAPVFARSDVYAQLLRVRLWAASRSLPLDCAAAAEEAAALAQFQISSDDPRIDGAFGFGSKGGESIPHINPVSTAFGLQALDMWHSRELPPLASLI